ncbi:hypothetical protein BT69DRAFT_1275847 [Atractiella rhizophila]|nr:hypothetical protein BT69DRAFT_1275847 [Atractiella rhizophila]
MNDELVIYPGDKVQILMNYDDGWVLGVNLSINPPQRGVFPRDCVEEADPSSPLPGATNGNNENKGNTLMGNNHFTIMEEDEDEPSELPYGPPSPKNKVADKAPFLPPIDFVTSSASPPTIAVEAPAEHNSNHIAGPGVGGVTPSQSSGNVSTASGKNVRRSSSLIASRDAELFVALGEALDDGKKRQQTNMI